VNDSQSYEKEFSHAFFSTVAMCVEVSVNNLTLISTVPTVNSDPTVSASVSDVPSGTDVSSGSTSKSAIWMKEHRIASSSAESDEGFQGAVHLNQISYLSDGKSGIILTYSIRGSLDLEAVQTILTDGAKDLTEALRKAGYAYATVSNVVSVTVLETFAFIQKRELGSGAIATIALAGIAVAFIVAVCYGKKHSKVADDQPGTRI
jgi:hypothetical protein